MFPRVSAKAPQVCIYLAVGEDDTASAAFLGLFLHLKYGASMPVCRCVHRQFVSGLELLPALSGPSCNCLLASVCVDVRWRRSLQLMLPLGQRDTDQVASVTGQDTDQVASVTGQAGCTPYKKGDVYRGSRMAVKPE